MRCKKANSLSVVAVVDSIHVGDLVLVVVVDSLHVAAIIIIVAVLVEEINGVVFGGRH